MAAPTAITKVAQYVIGDRREHIYTFTAPGSYTTGGDALTKADLGFASTADPEFDVAIRSAGGYVFEYDHTNSKVKAYRQTAATGALAEVSNGVDISAATGVRVVAKGRFGL